ncbi:MAG: isoaspartyl peptidase/L-asparaginase family protein [Betaproteobacteria bacterium]
MRRRLAIALHGGAGLARRADFERSRKVLAEALDAGYEELRKKTSLDAAIAAVVALEDCGLFNAGRGSCRTRDGAVEMDASVMEGGARRAGAVACVSRIRNPVLAARAVMEHTKHALLVAEGAEAFARKRKLPAVTARYFSAKAKGSEGTVGCVALDRDGGLAAATSTGGYAGKLPGRVGDSPLIGAGNYADDRSCAVSGTGIGEMFIRSALAHNVSARMLYLGEALGVAAAQALREVRNLGGHGGLVAVDRRGGVAMPFNSEIMYRAAIDARGRRTIAVR